MARFESIVDAAGSDEPFDIVLESSRTFGDRVAYLQVAHGGTEIRRWRGRFAALVDEERGFRPHVTLAARSDPDTVMATAAAFEGFRARFLVSTLALFCLAPAGWKVVSEGRMGGSRP